MAKTCATRRGYLFRAPSDSRFGSLRMMRAICGPLRVRCGWRALRMTGAALAVIGFVGLYPAAAFDADQASDQAPESSPALRERLAGANAARGRLLYLQCRSCHSLEKGDNKVVGPSLFGLFGSAAGTAEGFDYSQSLAESGIVWTPEILDRWLARPSDFLPGNRMVFAGLGDPEDRSDLILYLQQATRAQDEESR